ncbi:YKOF-related Family [Marinobacter daqiaonensis]|uniref:YKOF-related Family n=1 Tax=Marinobacter daqiaonensis TaxID=650891 RepID=A0A1I6JNX8_9GAMM|nr:YkoF family thiamine/hydroxymethylpyrimidine-binding protein [Marinobacter daqiaonensis]SFR80668.1 YKOF-related Family [Marinobacter daqiaonensis]
MYLSVELSFYPMTENFKPPIKDVVDRLKKSGLEVYADRISSEVFGEYDQVMRVLSDTMKWSFEQYGEAVFVAKFINGDRRPEE